MSDRFKFRVWDKINYKWMSNQLMDIEKGLLTCFYNDEEAFKRRYIIMQSTGLKDKNSKLIYEGDIVVIPNQYPFYDHKNKGEYQLNYVGIVEWIYSQWQYVYHCVNPSIIGISDGINNGLNDYGWDENENTEYLILGNIYEHKELIDGRN